MKLIVHFIENDHIGAEMRWTATLQMEPPMKGYGATKADALKRAVEKWARHGGE